MKHKFRGRGCVYCGAEADTSDHTIGRRFFLVERRDNLPQVPACCRCNNRKSELECYLIAGGAVFKAILIFRVAAPSRFVEGAEGFAFLPHAFRHNERHPCGADVSPSGRSTQERTPVLNR
jgi:hypothetical protein